jgi:asparagine synthase (glutamine-hydrolysing)
MREALESLLHDERYASEILVDQPQLLIGCTRYPQYPVRQLESEEHSYLLEGQIFGLSEPALLEEIQQAARWAFGNAEDRDRLGRWLREIDGEFILTAICRKSNAIAILNDGAGQLPFFYTMREGKFVGSREIRCVARTLARRTYDRIALAHFLLFRYSLSPRTLLEDVYRLAPGSLILIQLQAGGSRVYALNPWDFSDKAYRNVTLAENAQNICELLVRSCRSRASGSPNVLSLSGGLDSRLVAAALKEARVPFCAETFSSWRASRNDVRLAEELARLIESDWSCTALPEPCFGDALRLLMRTGGQNYLTMSFILPFLDRIRGQSGPGAVYFTGDTGVSLREGGAPDYVKDLDALARQIISWNGHWHVRACAAVARISPADLLESIRSQLATYPEATLDDKATHFRMMERSAVWHYDGMDRNRSFMPFAAPLEAMPVLAYTANCPDAQKAGHALYRALLDRISPRYAELDYAQLGVPIGSRAFGWKERALSLYMRLPYPLRQQVKGLLGRRERGLGSDSALLRCMQAQLSRCQALSDVLDLPPLDRIASELSVTQAETIFSLTSTLELLETGSSSLEAMDSEEPLSC